MAAIPVALAAVSAGASIMQGVGQHNQMNAQSYQSDYEAQLSERNAAIVGQQTDASESLQRRRAGQVLASQRASILQGGLGSGGSMGALAAQSGRDAEMDALNIRYEGGLRQTSLLEEAKQLKWQARQMRRGAKMALATSFLSAAASGYGAYAGAGGMSGAGPGGVMKNSVIPKIGGVSGGGLL